jgi:short-subunit dehydrogenase
LSAKVITPHNSAPAPGQLASRYGRWAVIAGASDGIGAEFARQVAAAGIHCVLVARRQGALEELGRELQRQYRVDSRVAAIDLSLTNAAELLEAATADLDVGLFVYNAGADPSGRRFIAAPLEYWQSLLSRNVSTLTSTTYAFARRMAAARKGGIILVGSYAAFGGADRLSVYSATKAFDLNFGESLWAELSRYDVDVLNVLIATADTPTVRRWRQRHQIPAGALPFDQPVDIVREALASLSQGPTLILGGDDLTGHPFCSNDARRKSVVETSRHLSRFYGKD